MNYCDLHHSFCKSCIVHFDKTLKCGINNYKRININIIFNLIKNNKICNQNDLILHKNIYRYIKIMNLKDKTIEKIN